MPVLDLLQGAEGLFDRRPPSFLNYLNIVAPLPDPGERFMSGEKAAMADATNQGSALNAAQSGDLSGMGGHADGLNRSTEEDIARQLAVLNAFNDVSQDGIDFEIDGHANFTGEAPPPTVLPEPPAPSVDLTPEQRREERLLRLEEAAGGPVRPIL